VAAAASGRLPRAHSSSGSGRWDERGDSSPSQPGKAAAAAAAGAALADVAQASAEEQQQAAEEQQQRAAQAAQQQAESLKQVWLGSISCHIVRMHCGMQLDVLGLAVSIRVHCMCEFICLAHSPGRQHAVGAGLAHGPLPDHIPPCPFACVPCFAPQQGNSAFQAGRYRQAHALYTQALELALVTPSLQAVLYCNRAAALNAEGSYVEAIVDCCLAGQLDGSLPRVLQVRCQHVG
jgi:tetratricopeptide (TPR) repeat protein